MCDYFFGSVTLLFHTHCIFPPFRDSFLIFSLQNLRMGVGVVEDGGVGWDKDDCS